jgi:hypothetical protein
MLDTFFIHRVHATLFLSRPEVNDPGPGQGKSVGICAIQLQERDVFFPSIERVCGDIPRQTIGGGLFACAGVWMGERVPDRGRAASSSRRTFDLVCA